MLKALKDWWLQWRAHRENLQLGKDFLALPHDYADPECVKWTGDRAGMNWKARCPSCNPAPVHFVLVGGGVPHAILELNPSDRFTGDRAKVTCPICLGVLSTDDAVFDLPDTTSDHPR